jgi:hypothetical protein
VVVRLIHIIPLVSVYIGISPAPPLWMFPEHLQAAESCTGCRDLKAESDTAAFTTVIKCSGSTSCGGCSDAVHEAQMQSMRLRCSP